MPRRSGSSLLQVTRLKEAIAIIDVVPISYNGCRPLKPWWV